MTLGEAITMVLNRVGLDTTNVDFKNEARNYINLTAVEVSNLVDWWWLDRTATFRTTDTLTVTSDTGAFAADATITGLSSGKTAKIDGYSDVKNEIYVYSPTGSFTADETVSISGAGSATFKSSAATRIYTPIESAVGAWHSFYDETNERALVVVGPDSYDLLTEDQTETGTVETVLVGGVDVHTGYPTIELWRAPDTPAEVIRGRYRIALTSWAGANDGSEFLTLGLPQILEGACVYGASKLYLAEKGDDAGSAREAMELNRVLELALRQNLRMQGNRSYPSVSSGAASPFGIIVDNTLVTVS